MDREKEEVEEVNIFYPLLFYLFVVDLLAIFYYFVPVVHKRHKFHKIIL